MKKKTIKALLSLVLSFSLVFGQPVLTFAEETPVAESGETVATPETSEEESSEESTEESSEDSTEEATEEASEEASEETTEEATEETTTEEASSEVAEPVQDELSALGFKTMDLTAEMYVEKKNLAEVYAQVAEAEAGEDYIENEVICEADSEEAALAIAECYGGELVSYEYEIAVISIKQPVVTAIRVAANEAFAIPAVYPNYIYSICGEEGLTEAEAAEHDVEDEGIVPVADEAVEVIGLENVYAANPTDPGFSSQYHHSLIHTTGAWDASQGEGVVVAVIDTGIDIDHPDLKDNILSYHSMIGGNGNDDQGHGTHCAGLIAAAQNNIGGVGVAPKAKLVSIKVLNSSGSGTTADIIRGVKLATEKKVDVISMSLGGICYSTPYQNAINAAVNKGIVVIAAAGNEGTDQKSYPAAYNNVISVGAVGSNRTFTNFSNYGSWVDIAAPGKDIYSTTNDGAYGNKSGTSMACPIVAGVAALVIGNDTKLRDTNTKATVTKVTKVLLDGAANNVEGAYSYHDSKICPLVDAEAAAYLVETGTLEMPTITFDGYQPDKKNVVDSRATFSFSTSNPHAKIFFTVNGKAPTNKVGDRFYRGNSIRLNTSGKIKIQAVAMIGNKKSKVFSKTYTFNALAVFLRPSQCTSTMKVAIGKKINLQVAFTPYFTSNKKLKWTSSDTTKMITVNASNGVVSCSSKAKPGTSATITATTTDGTNVSCRFTVTAVSEKASKLTLNATSINLSRQAGNSNLSMPGYSTSFRLVPTAEGTTVSQYTYKSSNTKVATVDASGNVLPVAKGKATITVTANDGSGKKATCTVKVVTPVQSIWGATNTGFSHYSEIPIGTGCSISIKPYVNDNMTSAPYVPSNKALTWTSSNPSAVSVNSSGKVTCNRNAVPGTLVTITATAKDGFGCKQTLNFKVYDKITKVYVASGKSKYSTLSVTLKVGETIYDPLTNGVLSVDTMKGTSNFSKSFSVTTPNRDNVYRYYNSDEDKFVVTATKKGSGKITYTAKDGSNTKFVLKINVKE